MTIHDLTNLVAAARVGAAALGDKQQTDAMLAVWSAIQAGENEVAEMKKRDEELNQRKDI